MLGWGYLPTLYPVAWYNTTMSDASRPVAPQHDPLRHTLSVREVAAQLHAAGVPRSLRHVQRLCENEAFDAARLGANDEWFIAPDSVLKVIGDLRALDEQRARRAASQRDTSRDVASELLTNPTPTRPDTTRRSATRRPRKISNKGVRRSPTRRDLPRRNRIRRAMSHCSNETTSFFANR
jgi:hypothetical protein